MYKNLNKVTEIVNELNCVYDPIDYFRKLTYFSNYSNLNREDNEMIIYVNDGEKVKITEGPLFKIFKYYVLLQNYDDFESFLQLLWRFLENFNNEFNFKDLANEVDDVINIRKQYNVYNSEDDEMIEYLKEYFNCIHFLLEELDKL